MSNVWNLLLHVENEMTNLNTNSSVPLWFRLPGEPIKWYRAFEIYRLEGPSRSLLAAYNMSLEEKYYQCHKEKQNKSKQVEWKPRKSNSKAWAYHSRQWNWKERAEAWDAAVLSLNKAKREKEISESLYSGLALSDERVTLLKEIASKLMSDFRDESKIWIQEERNCNKGGGQSSTTIKKFNDKLVRELRETLEDIALEKGERTKNIDLKTNGREIVSTQVHVYLPDNGRGENENYSICDFQ